MKQTKWWLGGVLAVLVLAILYALSADPSEEQVPATAGSRVEFTGAQLAQEQDGETVWRLGAKQIFIDPATGILYLEDAELWCRDGEREVAIRAREATADRATQTVTLQGTVEVHGNDGTAAKLGDVVYDGAANRLSATGGVRVQRGDVVLTGDRLTADRTLREITVSGHARAVKGESE